MNDPTHKDTLPAFFPFVGSNASAGGLYVFQCFLTALSAEFGFALVFVQHPATGLKGMPTDMSRSSGPISKRLEFTRD